MVNDVGLYLVVCYLVLRPFDGCDQKCVGLEVALPLRSKEAWGQGCLSVYCFIQFFSYNQGSRREKEATLLLLYICSTLDMSLYFIVLDSIFFFDLSLGVTNKENRFKDINNFCLSHAIGIRRRGHENDNANNP